ncbi:ribonuclease P protein component [Crocosphaera sp. UHCC 0190]|uniref:ribonuclease P protein component n=1 Tax=Crocosphaera sp. UHCC 0190 TaxID=3110246 RepID=UPI002B1FAC77|nr:ribonuclease P protein component [Crocosphaera sp. UHCC 0190]MEA5511362.1 ribonuclease P protein component [Crocosphaera sp. UHCC 0190]
MGLPKHNRLKQPKAFQAVYSQGKRYQSHHLVLRVLPQTNPENKTIPTQFGIAVSQKVSKKAVIRNRLKRQIRAAIRVLLPSVSPGYRIVIGIKRNGIECKYEHFLRELKELLINAEIIHGHKREHIL